MKIISTQVLKDYQGKPILQDKKPVQLRDIISTAINSMEKDRSMTSEQKNKAFQISVKLWAKKEINITVDDAAFIKERVGLFYSPLIYGRICELFDGKKEE